MKKTIVLLITLALLLLCATAWAEPAAGEQPAEGFFSWAMLATYAGATAATLAVTQVFKGVGFIDKNSHTHFQLCGRTGFTARRDSIHSRAYSRICCVVHNQRRGSLFGFQWCV